MDIHITNKTSIANGACKLIKRNILRAVRNRALQAALSDIDTTKGDAKGTPNFRDITMEADIWAVQLGMNMS